jgi:hypothetical protein
LRQVIELYILPLLRLGLQKQAPYGTGHSKETIEVTCVGYIFGFGVGGHGIGIGKIILERLIVKMYEEDAGREFHISHLQVPLVEPVC